MVRRIEGRKTNPSYTSLVKLASGLRMSVSDLVGGGEDHVLRRDARWGQVLREEIQDALARAESRIDAEFPECSPVRRREEDG